MAVTTPSRRNPLPPSHEFAETPARSFAFGAFVLIPERQLLLQGDAPIRIGGRALEILTTLVERAGEVMGKRQLMERVWPDVVVNDDNLKVNMAALRRALGDDPNSARYIATVTGRGYRFVAPVRATSAASSASTPPKRRHNLPTGTTRIFGRTAAIDAVRGELGRSRLVSIVGTGGVGKTTVALAAAEQVVDSFRDGVWRVDLALLKDPALAPQAIAAAIGLPGSSTDTLAAVCEFARDRELLLLLDSCEHLIDAAACCATRILAAAAGVRILVTSREPLMVNGERVRRLSGLEVPPPCSRMMAADALGFPAVQLFVERATAPFALDDAEAPLIAEICRSLDGLPLAIELAAPRVATFGVGGLLTQLDDCFRHLLSGRRSGPERHRALATTLDWSYTLLPAREAAMLRAVSVFTGVFDAAGASAVAGVTQMQATETLAHLAEKSLLAAHIEPQGIGYRLLKTTRTYCVERLESDSDEAEAVRLRHSAYRGRGPASRPECESTQESF